jgi:Tol biopolymer transport system component
MIVGGRNYTSTCIVEWNGSPLATTFADVDTLYVQITASQVAAAGSAKLTVKDTSNGNLSNTIAFPILSPAAAAAGVVQLITVAPNGLAANGDTLVPPSISQTGRFIAFQSSASNLTSDPANGIYQIFLRDTCIGTAASCTPSTQLVSVTDDGSPPNAQSRGSAVSADGRYVAFDSGASNLIPNSGICSPTMVCIYLRDTCTGVTTGGCTPSTVLASVATDGTIVDGANPTITPDGRFVAFNSTGSTLGVNQIVVRDTCHGAPSTCTPSTFTDSLNVAGQPGNENSLGQTISPDGRYAGFLTWSTNMEDPSAPVAQSLQSAWVRDTCRGAAAPCTPTSTRQDVSSDGTPSNGDLFPLTPAAISANGRFVSFSTDITDTDLVPETVSFGSVYWRDNCTGAASGCKPSTMLASIGNDGSLPNSGSNSSSISEDGRYVVFTSIATNLNPFGGYAAGSWQEIFARDTCAGAPPGCSPSTVTLDVMRTPPNLFIFGNNVSGFGVISGDGHYVVFVSNSSNFFPSAKVQNAMVYLGKTGF